MADVLKNLAKGTLTTGSTSLYTAPAGVTTIVKEILLCNKTNAPVTVTITFDGTNILFQQSIPAYYSFPFDLHSIVGSAKVIAGLASANAAIDYYMSGIEVN